MKTAVVLSVFFLTSLSSAYVYQLPHSQAPATARVQLGREGQTYVAYGNQILRLDPQLTLVQSVSLSSPAIRISLGNGGQDLVICKADLSCVVYDAMDLSVAPQSSDVMLANDTGVALFSSGTHFYTGSSNSNTIRLSRGDLSNRASDTKNERIIDSGFLERDFVYGFSMGNCSYYVIQDEIFETSYNFKFFNMGIVKACHDSSCCVNDSSCNYYTAVYEETIVCGTRDSLKYVDICSVSLVENYANTDGKSILLSLCNSTSDNKNQVCSISIQQIDNNLDKAYENCVTGTNECAETFWSGRRECNAENFPGQYCFSSPLGDTFDCLTGTIHATSSKLLLQLAGTNGDLLSSVPIELDGLSLLMISYKTSETENFIGLFNFREFERQQHLENALYTKNTSSPVLDLKWTNGLDFVVATTKEEILTIPIEECSKHTDCASCIFDKNILCGWCTMENKCSTRSKCNGSSLNQRSWIQSDSSDRFCVLPNQFILDNERKVNISVYPIGISSYDSRLTYSCDLESIEGTVLISIEAVQIGTGGSYACTLDSSQIPTYQGVSEEFRLKFRNSDSEVLLEGDSVALSVYNCSTANRCADCLTNQFCGWCMNSKKCTGLAENCTSPQNFTQLSMGQTFDDVCPLLILKNGTAKYQQHVQIQSDLLLSTRNLPPAISPYVYKCQIGSNKTDAHWNNEMSITCLVQENQIDIENGSLTTTINILWIGPGLEYVVGTLSQIHVDLFNCNNMASDCSSCVQDMTGYPCGWCSKGSESRCSLDIECTSSSSEFLTSGIQCPAPVITSFLPASGPPSGGTVITIKGTDLGVSISDFSSENSIMVGDAPCVSLDMKYISGKQVLCRTTNTTQLGKKRLVINLIRESGPVRGTSQKLFQVLQPTVMNVTPEFGPIAGGSLLTIEGTNLDIGQKAEVTLYGYSGIPCKVISRNSTYINCRTENVSHSTNESGFVVVHIDSEDIANEMVMFRYTPNPILLSVTPRITIPSGGINITFTGSNIDVVQDPQLVINGTSHNCSVLNSSALFCITPRVTTEIYTLLMYSVQLDDTPFPNINVNPHLQIQVNPDPVNFGLSNKVLISGEKTANLVVIKGHNLQSVLVTEYVITVGGKMCENISISTSEIYCIPPLYPKLSNGQAEVIVFVGRNLRFLLAEKLMFIVPRIADPSSLNSMYLLALLIPLLLLCCIILVILWITCHHRRSNRKGVIHVTNKEFYLVQEQARMNAYDGLDIGAQRRKQTKSSADLMEEMTSQLPRKLLIAQDQMQILDIPIGQGQFGTVYKGNIMLEVNGRNTSQDVAVKSFKGLMSSDVQDIFAEIFKMQDLSHPNVMTLIGVCISIMKGPCIVMPYMANGSLLNYLKNERSNIYLSYYAGDDTVASVKKLLLRMCYQISLGMDYLSHNQIVHRDLAARNCLLDSEGNIKVSDFGLSEDIYVTGYFRQRKDDAVRLPFKWMAPESLRDGLFTHKSDVWSFGITCWEIFTGGRTPYPGVDAIDLFKYLEEGVRLDHPGNAASDDDIYSLMLMCWSANPENRPSFQEIPTLISNKLEPISEYMEMSMFLQPQKFDEYLVMNSIQEKRDMQENTVIENIPEIKISEDDDFEEMILDSAF